MFNPNNKKGIQKYYSEYKIKLNFLDKRRIWASRRQLHDNILANPVKIPVKICSGRKNQLPRNELREADLNFPEAGRVHQ